MSKRNHSTLADYAVVALCPSLIVLLLSSLVYFVVLCAYHGEYSSRLGYIWFMFILGAVGIARISIEQSRAYATGYAAVLGLATLFVLSRFQVLGGGAAALSPLVNALLIATVWFLADRITFDCTLIDDDKDASGQGLLDGLSSCGDETTEESAAAARTGRKKSRRRSRQGGRTVLWLTAAALPLFGIGQFLLRSDPRLQSAARFALAVYLFAALSLLVATSFLGVRRYLRQRGAEMPANVSAAWLGGGVMVTALILMLCFALPQPGRMLASIELPAALQSPDWLSPSRYGWGGEGADPSRGPEDASRAPGEGQDASGQGDAGTQAGHSGKPSSEGEQQSGGQQSGGQQSGGQQSGGQQSGGQQSGGQQPGGQQPGGQQPGGQQSAGQQSGDQRSGEQQPAVQQQRGEQDDEQGRGSPPDSSAGDAQRSDSGDTTQRPQGEEQTAGRAAGDAQGEAVGDEKPETNPPAEQPERTASESRSASSAAQSANQPSTAPSPSSRLLPSLTTLIKAIIYLALLAIIAAFLWMHRAALADFWQRLLAWLATGGPEEPADGAADALPPEAIKPLRPFASFTNPLLSGQSPELAVIETFQAAEAWYREKGQPRRADETPQEYIRRLQSIDVDERRALTRLSEAYNRIVYGGGKAGARDLQTVGEVWQSFSLKEPLRL